MLQKRHNGKTETMDFGNYRSLGKPPAPDQHLHKGNIQVERKHFVFDLRQNARGRFLRITEEVGGRFDAIVIPVSGLEEFRKALDEAIKHNQTLPPAP
jgi:hypothetical protein